MEVNERIARALGFDTEARAEHQWVALIGDHNIEWCDRCCAAVNTCCGGKISEAGLCEPVFPDYAHSLDACLPVLADLEAKGYGWRIESLCMIGKITGGEAYMAEIGRWQRGNRTPWKVIAQSDIEDTPAAALAECIAQALEAEKSPD